jgi:hypothetical protein
MALEQAEFIHAALKYFGKPAVPVEEEIWTTVGCLPAGATDSSRDWLPFSILERFAGETH